MSVSGPFSFFGVHTQVPAHLRHGLYAQLPGLEPAERLVWSWVVPVVPLSLGLLTGGWGCHPTHGWKDVLKKHSPEPGGHCGCAVTEPAHPPPCPVREQTAALCPWAQCWRAGHRAAVRLYSSHIPREEAWARGSTFYKLHTKEGL